MSIKRKNNRIKLGKFIAFAVLTFFVFLINDCFSDEVEVIEIGTEVWSGQKILDGDYVITGGNLLTIEKGSEIIFQKNSSLTLEGGLIKAIGTEKEPIILRSFDNEPNSYYIYVDEASGIYFRNVDISGGGKIPEESPDEPPGGLLTFIKKAQAQEIEYGVLTIIESSFFILDKCNIHNNSVGIFMAGLASGDFVQVNRSRFFDNTAYSVISRDNEKPSLDFKYNWWQSDNQLGSIDDSFEKTTKDFKDPVLIIPGIMGSTEWGGELYLDLILHTYDDLVESLIASGYVQGENLFLFPYQWRDSNIDNAILLKNRIQEIKAQANSNRVDIVAHSMGGLVAREYLESGYYQNDIDQLITLGTPHQGAPKGYPRWEAGIFAVDNFNIFSQLGKLFFTHEAEENGYENLYDYIHNRPIASIQELLPVYDYLWDKDSDQQKIYPNDYPQNNFLENLNETDKISLLREIEFNNIIGSRGDDSTIASYKVIESEDEYWEHGYPDDFNSILGDRGMVYGPGDETVPLASANFPNQYATYTVELDSKHGNLPTDSQQDVIELLSGIRPTEKIDDIWIENMLFVSVFSPIDILITLADGRRIGTDPETGEIINEVEGAYYSGNETNVEFITIPNYEDMEYEISAQGTGEGEFRVEVTSLDNLEGEIVETQVEEWQGTTVDEQVQTFGFEVGDVVDDDDEEGDDEEDEDKDDKKWKKDQGRANFKKHKKDFKIKITNYSEGEKKSKGHKLFGNKEQNIQILNTSLTKWKSKIVITSKKMGDKFKMMIKEARGKKTAWFW